MAGSSHRASTDRIYHSKWKPFAEWCIAKNLDPYTATEQVVADFLLHMFNQGRAVSTVGTYRSAILQTLKMRGTTDLQDSTVIHQLMRSFRLERPRNPRVVPRWDLNLVLSALLKPPFEPMATAGLKEISWKTYFLILLAAGRRRSDIHAVAANRVYSKEDNSQVILYPLLGFLPKAIDAAEGGARFQPITIPALTNSIGHGRDEPDRLLCPVRALKFYRQRTEQLRGGRKRLFIPYKVGSTKELGVNTLSSWTKLLIQLAYKTVSDQDLLLRDISAHEARGIAASLAVQATFSLEDIMASCIWKNHSTFTDYYLRDVSYILENLHTLGPIVAAGKVIG